VASTFARGAGVSALTEAVRIVREAERATVTTTTWSAESRRAAQLDEIGAEIVQTSMLVGEAAYDIEPGWLGVPVVTREAGRSGRHRSGEPGRYVARSCPA
jgi:hypothetical protein